MMKQRLALIVMVIVVVMVTLAQPPGEPRPRSGIRPPDEPTAEPTSGRWQPPTPVICWQSPLTPVPGVPRICLPPRYTGDKP